jgi:hypothetical protein
MIIYCWECPTCERKGATNIKPISEIQICLQCGENLIIEMNRCIFDYS